VAVEKVKSEITGKVWKLIAKPGQKLAEEETIILIESMKMEIPVMAPAACTLKRVLVGEGDDVAEGQDLAEIEL